MNIAEITAKVDNVIKDFCNNETAEFGCILGSGLGEVADSLENRRTLSYAEIPYLKPSTIKGHAGKICFGKINNKNIVCFQGRPHWYEGVKAESFVALIAVVKAFGANSVVITNAAGGINPNYKVGDVVMITDHINMQFKNPLIGVTPPPFIGMDQVYDISYQQRIKKIAAENKINLHTGVYCGVQGPSFETPAEIKAYKSLGADVVAMSMIPEVIVARYFNFKVLALSVISNPAAGLCEQQLSHEVTLSGVKKGRENLNTILLDLFKQPALFSSANFNAVV